MQADAFKDADTGIDIRYHTDDSLFNIRMLKAKTKVKIDTINHYLFADDCALSAASVADMQHSVDRFPDACDIFGLTLSAKRMEKMHH